MSSEAQRQDKRQAILAAALGLFSRKGVGATTMPELAKAAGVGAGTLYRHFQNKSHIFNVLFRTCKQRYRDAILHEHPWGESPRARVSHFLRAALTFALANRQAIEFLEFHHHGEWLDGESESLREQTQAPALAFLAEGQHSGRFSPLPPALLLGLVEGAMFGVLRQVWSQKARLDPVAIGLLEEAVWGMLTAGASCGAKPKPAEDSFTPLQGADAPPSTF